MDVNELREIRDSMERDLEAVNRGFDAAHALEQRVTAVAAALSVLLDFLIRNADRASGAE